MTEAVTDYVREGYNQALREKKRHIGFLMILMQRLVVSSTRAIRTTLERRLELGAQPAADRRRSAYTQCDADRTSDWDWPVPMESPGERCYLFF